MAFAGGVLIDADHPRRRDIRFWQGLDQAQDRASADGDAQNRGQSGTGPARQGETYRSERGAQPLGALAVLPGQAGYLLDEGPARTHPVQTPEAPDVQAEYDSSPTARDIGRKP
ncbi:hypothetical protein OIE63_39145 [Streptomyces sp. NBC_01795]|uniref:hypothetical protein n=1 Tax=Streptomyces sp. NBC_01795 TaxID=2975943 RepID=UPI002DDB93F6|nr:hypothetical protein [Streptomyces sp. NBC_01795]WSA97521.1 hypothetical protein OIE63_00015 [Streptomyces sp. NBC_01795]WSA97549.1 hypothetical protein OIE63_39145 [Streptomyces sp. NBC_01795]